MRVYRYAFALGGLLLAGAGSAFGQIVPPATGTAPPPAEPAPIQAPPAPAQSAPYGPGMKVNLSPDGSKYLRLMLWSQIYTRYTKNNTGTLRAPARPKDSQVEFGIRRSRMVLLAQLNPRFLVYTHLGINNQNAVSGGVTPTADGKKPQFFIHEAVTEYRVNQYLNLGAGLHYFNGISRLTSASTTSMLAMDFPLTNFPTIEATDQFARWLGVYAKGRIAKFDYRVSMSDAFLTNQASTPLSLGSNGGGMSTGTGIANYNPQNSNHVYQGYFSYNFLEPEANLLPYTQGTYLGTKRVFSVGAGFLYNNDAMYSRPTSSSVAMTPAVTADPFGTVATRKHDMKMFGVDAFYDVPLDTASRSAITIYGVYYRYNMGPNHVRFIGPENPGFGTAATRGNAFPQSGTGNSQYLQAGYLMPRNTLGPKARLQPYVAYLHSSYEGLRLSDPVTRTQGERKGVNMVDLGANLLLDGHNAKVTLNYRHRPDFSNVNAVKYRPEITLQTQVFL